MQILPAMIYGWPAIQFSKVMGIALDLHLEKQSLATRIAQLLNQKSQPNSKIVCKRFGNAPNCWDAKRTRREQLYQYITLNNES